VGEIDDVHHAEDHGQAQGHQGEEQAHQNSLKQRVDKDHIENPKEVRVSV
jgi:hypothetical protein